jgi:hypothetical protein
VLKQLFDYVLRLLLLVRQTDENRADIDDLQRRVEVLSEKVVLLANDVRRINEREQHEREKLVLRLENALLKFERQLPPAKETKKLKG